MEWLELMTSTITTLLRILKSCTLAAAQLAVSTIRLAAWPIAGLWGTLLFVFSPVIHTARFMLSPVFWLLNSFPRLQPLYIYFGSAAFIGLLAGLLLRLSSLSMLTILNLYDDPATTTTPAVRKSTTKNPPHSNPPQANNFLHNLSPLRRHRRRSSPSSSSPPARQHYSNSGNENMFLTRHDDYYDDALDYSFAAAASSSRPTTPNNNNNNGNNSSPSQREQQQLRADQRRLEMLLLAADLSSPESRGRGREAALAAALASGGWRDSPNTKRKRRSVGIGGGLGGSLGGLGGGGGGAGGPSMASSSSRFHTILEEEDDSL